MGEEKKTKTGIFIALTPAIINDRHKWSPDLQTRLAQASQLSALFMDRQCQTSQTPFF